MRASLDVSVSVKPTVHVSDADQSTDAPVALPPSANVSDDSEPEFPAALFQFLAGLTPATFVDVHRDYSRNATRASPHKANTDDHRPGRAARASAACAGTACAGASRASASRAGASCAGAARAARAAHPACPWAIRAPGSEVHRQTSVGRERNVNPAIPRRRRVSHDLCVHLPRARARHPVAVPPAPPVVVPPVAVPPVPPAVAPPVPPVPLSTGRLVSTASGTSIPPSRDEVASATGPASGSTLPAAPPIAIPLVPGVEGKLCLSDSVATS